jgi:hypothetical protein
MSDPQSLTPEYHPSFDTPEAGDVILVSVEETHYRVPSNVLRRSSGFFRTMLSLPQKDSTENEPVRTDEKDTALEPLLRIMCCMELEPWTSYDQLEGVLFLADKYDAPGVLAIVRMAITTPLFLSDPLRLYVLATRFHWKPEASIALKNSLSLDIHDEAHHATLSRLSGSDIMSMISLRRLRVDVFTRLLDSDYFGAGNADDYVCSTPRPGCKRVSDNHAWRKLKARLIKEISVRPSEEAVLITMHQWPETEVFRAAKCPTCGHNKFAWADTMANIKLCAKKMPYEMYVAVLYTWCPG